MAKHKYKPRRGKDSKSLRRASPSKKSTGNSILIVTEGINTETVYFEAIRKLFSATSVEIVVQGTGKGDPAKLKEHALSIKKERYSQAKRGQLALDKAKKFDEIWLVFDTDVLTKEKRNDGISSARTCGLKIAYSEPCFEYWLLLHSKDGYTTAQMKKCTDVETHLKKAFCWDAYGKNREWCRTNIPSIVSEENITRAREFAKRVRNYHAQHSDDEFPNPSTDVDFVIASIERAVHAANHPTLTVN